MTRVIIESPHAGDVERNTTYARRALADSLSRGEAPMASHLLYTQALDDNDPAERRQGIAAGFAWADVAERFVFYLDYGFSAGMEAAYRRYTSRFGLHATELEVRHIGPNPEPHAFLANEPSLPRDLCMVCHHTREKGDHIAPPTENDKLTIATEALEMAVGLLKGTNPAVKAVVLPVLDATLDALKAPPP